MSSKISIDEILETVDMIVYRHLNIRAVTLGINVMPAATSDPTNLRRGVSAIFREGASRLAEVVGEISSKYGIEIVNRRVTLTPLSIVASPMIRGAGSGAGRELVSLAREIDGVAADVDVDMVGGYGALVQKGESAADVALEESIPEALAATRRVCSAVNVADSRSGINVDAVLRMGQVISRAAELSPGGRGESCARLMVLANAPDDNPFMAGGFHGLGTRDLVVNVGISGPAVLLAAVRSAEGADITGLAEIIKRVAFKITRVGELVGREVASRIGAEFGAVDISLAPAPAEEESVAKVLEAMGIEKVGLPGTVGAMMILTDSLKKGGAMAASRVGGFSGVMTPVSEDLGMARRAAEGVLDVETLLAMSSVSATGTDMVPVPGDTPPEVLASIILDQMAIGVVTGKPVGVRLLPVPGAAPGDVVDLGGLFGSGVVLDVPRQGAAKLLARRGRVPPPITSLRG
ncbi:MAG: PFL family protein [Conexivisphaera sp.]|jgi:uncharacterized protein (UPF0210 family)|nr:PFL family protein [Conexivisphaerales archaeon]